MRKTEVFRFIGVEHISCEACPTFDAMYMSIFLRVREPNNHAICDILTTIYLN
jgi:hypothetical protein